MTITDKELRDIVRNMPEVKRLLIERRQIQQDGQKKGTYTKPTPHLTPSNDKHHPKRHKYDKGKDLIVKKNTQDELKENAKNIKKAAHDYLKKNNEIELSKNYKQFKPDELIIFIEKGREQVLKDRAKEKTKEIHLEKKEPIKAFDRLQQAFDKIKWDFKEEQIQENKKDIQQGREYSR